MENLAKYYNVGVNGYEPSASAVLNWMLSEFPAVEVDALPEPLKWNFDTPVNVVRNGQNLKGYGSYSSVMYGRNNNLPQVTIAAGLNGVTIKGLHLQRQTPAYFPEATPSEIAALTPVAGAAGIRALGTLSNCVIEDNHIQDQWNGAVLRSAENGHFCRNIIIGSYSKSLLGTNGNASWDWQVYNNLISKGDDDGVLFMSSVVPGAPAVCALGSFRDNRIFSLTGYGIAIVGHPQVRVSKFQLDSGFIGSTAKSAVLLDSYEGYHSCKFTGFEQVGVDKTGRDWNTPASNIGSAVEITENNGVTDITGIRGQTIAHNGISSRAPINVNGGLMLNCGTAGLDGYRNGVAAYAGEANINGLKAGNTPGGSAQAFGLWGHNADAVRHHNCDFRNNAVGETFMVTGA